MPLSLPSLPEDILIAILSYLFASPDPRKVHSCLPILDRWYRPSNKDLFALSLVCRAFQIITLPYRFSCIEVRSRERLEQMLASPGTNAFPPPELKGRMRYLSISFRENLNMFASTAYPGFQELSTLGSLQLVCPEPVGPAFISSLAACRNLQSLWISCSWIIADPVPKVASLRLKSLHVEFRTWKAATSPSTAIQTLLSGETCNTLETLELSLTGAAMGVAHTMYPSIYIPEGITFPSLTSLAFTSGIIVEDGYLARLSPYLPRLRFLSVENGVIAPADSGVRGDWPSLSRLFIEYSAESNAEVFREQLFTVSKSLEYLHIRGLQYPAPLASFCDHFRSASCIDLRVLIVNFEQLHPEVLFATKDAGALVSSLPRLEELTIWSNLRSCGYHEYTEWFYDFEAWAMAFGALQNLRILRLNPQVAANAVSDLAPIDRSIEEKWRKQNGPEFLRHSSAFAFACSALSEILWGLSGQTITWKARIHRLPATNQSGKARESAESSFHIKLNDRLTFGPDSRDTFDSASTASSAT